MLKKLFKYEFRWMLCKMLIVWIVVFGLGVVCCLSGIMTDLLADAIEKSSFLKAIFMAGNVSVFALLSFSEVVSVVFCFIISATRFYRNLYSSEGYFTLCTPTKPSEHVFCKMLTTVCFFLMTIVVCFVATLISQAHSGFEIIEHIGVLLKNIFSRPLWWLYTIEILIGFAALVFFAISEGYLAVSLGQAFKNRVVGAVVCYFLVGFLIETALSILFAVYMQLAFVVGHMDGVAFAQVTVWLAILCVSGLAVGSYAIVINRLGHKLNLE